jgi:hypothetical protein
MNGAEHSNERSPSLLICPAKRGERGVVIPSDNQNMIIKAQKMEDASNQFQF